MGDQKINVHWYICLVQCAKLHKLLAIIHMAVGRNLLNYQQSSVILVYLALVWRLDLHTVCLDLICFSTLDRTAGISDDVIFTTRLSAACLTTNRVCSLLYHVANSREECLLVCMTKPQSIAKTTVSAA